VRNTATRVENASGIVGVRRHWHSLRTENTSAVYKRCKQTVSSTIGLVRDSYALVFLGLRCGQVPGFQVLYLVETKAIVARSLDFWVLNKITPTLNKRWPGGADIQGAAKKVIPCRIFKIFKQPLIIF